MCSKKITLAAVNELKIKEVVGDQKEATEMVQDKKINQGLFF